MQPAPGADPVHRGDDRLPHVVVPSGQAQLGSARPSGLLAQGVGITAQLDHVEAGLEGVPFPGVHDDADGRVLVQLAPGLLQFVEHDGVHGVPGGRTVEDEPADRTIAFNQQRGVRAQLRGTSLHGSDEYGSGSRGSPRTRSATMFLLISVVPPSIVLARLRSIPRTSWGNVSA